MTTTKRMDAADLVEAALAVVRSIPPLSCYYADAQATFLDALSALNRSMKAVS